MSFYFFYASFNSFLFVKRNIFVVLTTNHKENITGPMLRSGRTDLVIDIEESDASIFKYRPKTFPASDDRINTIMRNLGDKKRVRLVKKL